MALQYTKFYYIYENDLFFYLKEEFLNIMDDVSNNVTLSKENFWLELSADYFNSVKSSQSMENDIKMSLF